MKQCFSRKMSSKPPCETPWRPFKLHPPSVRVLQPTVLSGSLAAAWISHIHSSCSTAHQASSVTRVRARPWDKQCLWSWACLTDTQRHNTHTRSHQMLGLCFCKWHHIQSCFLVTQHKTPMRGPDRAGDQCRNILQNRDCARAG